MLYEGDDGFVVVSFYQKKNHYGGKPIVHVWGPPQPTRAKAITIMRRHKREAEQHYSSDEVKRVKFYITRLHR